MTNLSPITVETVSAFMLATLEQRSISEKTLRGKVFSHFGAANVSEKEVNAALVHLKRTKAVEKSGTEREFLDIANRGKSNTSVELTKYIVSKGSVLEATVRGHVERLRGEANLSVGAREVNATIRGLLRNNKFERVVARMDKDGNPVYRIQVKGFVAKDKAPVAAKPAVIEAAPMAPAPVEAAQQIAA